MSQNIVNWREFKTRSRRDLQSLHPMMFSEQGYLVPKQDAIVRYDRDYVIFKLSRMIEPIVSNNNVQLQELLKEATQARFDSVGNRLTMEATEGNEETE